MEYESWGKKGGQILFEGGKEGDKLQSGVKKKQTDLKVGKKGWEEERCRKLGVNTAKTLTTTNRSRPSWPRQAEKKKTRVKDEREQKKLGLQRKSETADNTWKRGTLGKRIKPPHSLRKGERKVAVKCRRANRFLQGDRRGTRDEELGNKQAYGEGNRKNKAP